jgi:glycosyltransferase 2 family protein
MAGKVLRRLLFVLSLAFVVDAAIKLAKDWDTSSVRLNPTWLALAFLVAILASWLQSFSFLRLLESWSERSLPSLRTREIFFASQLARYTPGRLGLPAMRMARAAELNLPKEQLAAVTLGEVVVWLVTGGMALALGLATTDHKAFGAYAAFSKLGYAIAGGLLLVALALGLLPRRLWLRLLGPKLASRLFATTSDGQRPLLPLSAMGLVFGHWLGWLLHGALVGLSVGAPLSLFTYSGTALLLSIFAGFFSFFAPAGVGVREAVLAYSLAPWVGAANATLVGVLARAASLAAELILFAALRFRLERTPDLVSDNAKS